MFKKIEFIAVILIFSLIQIPISRSENIECENLFSVYLETDENSVMNILVPCAEKGDHFAQLLLADEYFFTLKDYALAYKWYQSASAEYYYATYRLGTMYENGQHVFKNNKKAIELYHEAADGGIEEAQFKLGYIYGEKKWGFKLIRDYEESLKWFKKVAEAEGELAATAAYNVYVIYSNEWAQGDTNKWLKIAADLGNEEAIKLSTKLSKQDAEDLLKEYLNNN